MQSTVLSVESYETRLRSRGKHENRSRFRLGVGGRERRRAIAANPSALAHGLYGVFGSAELLEAIPMGVLLSRRLLLHRHLVLGNTKLLQHLSPSTLR